MLEIEWQVNNIVQLGLNEADTFKSSSILIYWQQRQNIYKQEKWLDAAFIKKGMKQTHAKVVVVEVRKRVENYRCFLLQILTEMPQ